MSNSRSRTRLPSSFFNLFPLPLARQLLGKIIRHRVEVDGRQHWLAARIIETEAYELRERASHSSLGRTPSREPMFMPPGTLYLYYARGGDSLNFSARGEGNAVLVKSAFALHGIETMQSLNPGNRGPRVPERLCSGQTLLCKSLGITVKAWNGRKPDGKFLRFEADSYEPQTVIQCPRLGIRADRDAHLQYRFVDSEYARYCTSNPLTRRAWKAGRDFRLIKAGEAID